MTDLPLLISTLEQGDHGLVGSSPEGETAFPRVGQQLRAGEGEEPPKPFCHASRKAACIAAGRCTADPVCND